MRVGRKRIYPLGTTLAQKILTDLKKQPGNLSCSKAKLAEILRSPYRPSPGTVTCPLKDVSVWEIAPPPRAARTLRNLNIKTVGQLLATSIEDLMSQWSFGRLSIANVQDALCRLLLQAGPAEDQSPMSYSSFESMVVSYTELVVPNRRAAIIAIERLGLYGKPATLVTLGMRFGITRERIRQIEADGIGILASPPNWKRLYRFWEEVWAMLQPAGKPYPLVRLAESIRKRFGWEEAPPIKPLVHILQLHPNVAIVDDGREITTRTGHWSGRVTAVARPGRSRTGESPQ